MDDENGGLLGSGHMTLWLIAGAIVLGVVLLVRKKAPATTSSSSGSTSGSTPTVEYIPTSEYDVSYYNSSGNTTTTTVNNPGVPVLPPRPIPGPPLRGKPIIGIPKPTPAPAPAPVHQPPTPPAHYQQVGTWGQDPVTKTTLWGIFKSHGLSLAQGLALPGNAKYRANPNLIHPNDMVQY